MTDLKATTMLHHTEHTVVEADTTPMGEDIRITCDEGYAIECGGEYVREMCVTIERHKLPIPGRRYVLGGRLVKVADWHYDETGTPWVVTDAGEQVRWDG